MLSARVRWAVPALLVAAGCAAAGVWQYGRGVQKEAMLQAYAVALRAPPAALEQAIDAGTVPVRVRGAVQPAANASWVLLDNQVRDSRVGVRAYAIVQTTPAQPRLLVDFGWLPLGAGRALPELPAVPASLQVDGLLVATPGQAMRLGRNPALQATAPTLVAYLDPAELAAQLQQPIADRVLRVDAGAAFGFARDAQQVPTGLPPERHYGYALQWGGLATAVIVIYLILSLRKPRA